MRQVKKTRSLLNLSKLFLWIYQWVTRRLYHRAIVSYSLAFSCPFMQSDEIRTIKDALVHLTIPETIDDFVSSTRGTVTATKQYFLDALPPVLILHLKRFVYSSNRGVQKLMKRIGFGPILDIDPGMLRAARVWTFLLTAAVCLLIVAILSPIARTQPPPKYRLFAVVYHVGHLAGGGHYTCSVLRAGGEWLHIDDTAIERTTEDDVIAAARPGYDPYLLYYIRV